MKTTALANWFGSNRMLGEHVGKLLKGCTWVGVPFAGGMCELAHIDANVMLVSDLHRHVINLANVVRERCPELVAALDAMPFHPDVLVRAQVACIRREVESNGFIADHMQVNKPPCDLAWAADYFVSSWMGRGGSAGTEKEFDGAMSIRWKSGGGDSAVRFRSAIKSLTDWQTIMRRCTFVCLDVFDFLAEAIKRDIPENGIYLDPPWPDDGDQYKHKFAIAQQRRLAEALAEFEHTRIVVRYGDHPLIRELYPESWWKWTMLDGRTRANKTKAEVLIVSRSDAGRRRSERKTSDRDLFTEVA